VWPRICELLLALWLIASPFVLGRAERLAHVRVDVLAGVVVAVLAALSFGARRRRAHLGNVIVAAALAVHGYVLAGTEPSAAAQNHLLVGLTLLMIAVIPSDASRPPAAWRSSG
jgi:hypothetical protein